MLNDILVLELANVLAGPAAAATFAELGASVIKVENLRIGGDVTRTWKLPDEDPDSDISAYFSCANWGKQSLALDLLTSEGMEIVHALAAKADIVIASYKPGDAEKLKVDYTTLSRRNPRLIYAHLTGYGPNNDRAGYDAIIQAETGFTLINGEAGRKPVKMPVALMDILAAHHMKEAILLALLNRERTGQGTYIDVSLFRSGISSLANQATNWLVGGRIPQAMGSDHPNIVPYGTIFFTCDKKPVVLAVGSDKQFVDLCRVLEVPEMAHDQRFATNQQRVRHREILTKMLTELIAKMERKQLLEGLNGLKVPAGGVFDMKEVFELPESQEMLIESRIDEDRQLKGVRNIAFRMKELNFGTPAAPPHFGEHTREVLENLLNYSKERIDTMIQKKVIYDRNNS
ncbi:MAG TPA: CaiB/BaiF CoA-transferase family protein [Bacteroidales bacterium]|nr:CaiB/BaiF CoA-transferase family protein [Bacteroidales bacterium]